MHELFEPNMERYSKRQNTMLQLATLVLEAKWFPTILLLNQLFSDFYKVYPLVGLASERQGGRWIAMPQ